MQFATLSMRGSLSGITLLHQCPDARLRPRHQPRIPMSPKRRHHTITCATDWTVWTYLAATAATSHAIEKRTRVGTLLSSPLIAMLVGAAGVGLGVIPIGAAAYDVVWTYLMPLATSCYLLQCDLRDLFHKSNVQVGWSLVLGCMRVDGMSFGKALNSLLQYVVVGFSGVYQRRSRHAARHNCRFSSSWSHDGSRRLQSRRFPGSELHWRFGQFCCSSPCRARPAGPPWRPPLPPTISPCWPTSPSSWRCRLEIPRTASSMHA